MSDGHPFRQARQASTNENHYFFEDYQICSGALSLLATRVE
jgi:hypothetical protein